MFTFMFTLFSAADATAMATNITTGITNGFGEVADIVIPAIPILAALGFALWAFRIVARKIHLF